MEEQKRDGLKKKFIVVRKRKAVAIDKSTTSDQPKKRKLRIVVKRKPEPTPEVIEVNVQKEPEIKPVQIEITVPKKTRTRKTREAKVEVKTDGEVKPKRTRRKKTEEVSASEEKPKTKRTRKTSSKSKVEKKVVPVYDPDPFLEREVSALNIARCLRKLKDIIKGRIDF